MEILAAFLGGLVIGWLAGRSGGRTDQPAESRTFKPTKRQRQILATLPPDPKVPSLDDLIEEEVADLGLHDVPGSEQLSAQVMLKVWKRDRPLVDPGPTDILAFEIVTAASHPHVTVDDVRLVSRDRAGGEAGNQPGGVGV